jgi:DNA-binding beta-propeller fold protein YncE
MTSEGDLQGRGGGGPALVKPYGVDVHGGRVFVCDSDLHGVSIFDLRSRALQRFLPAGDGSLRTPINCTVDPANGDLYVTDGDRKDVTVFDSTLAYVDNIAVEGGRAADVFVDGDTLWISDMDRRVVDVYHKPSRRLVRTISGGDEEAEGRILQPTNIWVTDRHLYVSDFGQFAVNVYDRAGNHVRSVGSYGRVLGQFVRPKGIAVDREDRLYVVDAAFANVQVFGPEGELLIFFGGQYAGLGGMWLPAKITLVDAPEEVARFEPFVMPGYDLEYLLFVTSQFGPDRLGVYGFVRPEPAAEPGG